VASVVITRQRHPLVDRSLRVLGQTRRDGRLELLLVLPDCSKSLIPAAWTDPDESGDDAPQCRHATQWGGSGRGVDAWICCTHPRCWPPCVDANAAPPEIGCTAVILHGGRPCSLGSSSLLPDQVPAPPPDLLTQLPQPQLSASITLLGRLIAQAATSAGMRVGDE
jgi:hypothetical protein